MHKTLVLGIGRFSSFGKGAALIGALRTTDGGATWNQLDGNGLLRGINISGVAPRGNTIVISSPNSGIFRSTDPSPRWIRISGASGTGLPTGSSFDLAGDPINTAILFTNAGGNGIYRSTDTGATWRKVSNADMDHILNSGVENVKIAVGIHNDVYVAVANMGELAALFRSGDGANSWSPLDPPHTVENGNVSFGPHPGKQAGIHLSLAADRTDANVVYIGGDRQPHYNEGVSNDQHWPNSIKARDYSGRLFRIDASKPTGTQTAALTHVNTASNSAPHADSRGMAVAINGDLLEVDDGGIYRRTNPRSNNGDWFSMNGNLQVTEFHSIAWDSNSHVIIGGAQDTGTPEQIAPSDIQWRSVSTGDGGIVAVDDFGTPGLSTRYSSYDDFDSFRRRTYDARNVFQSEVFPGLRLLGGGSPFQAQFYTPLEVNRAAPTRLVIGGANSVYESLDQGDTIREIGPGLRVNESSPIAYGARDNPNILYVGSGSKIYIRTGAHPASLALSVTYPGRDEIIGIALDPDNSKHAFAIDQGKIYRTTTGGAAWSEITGNLPTFNPIILRSIAFISKTNRALTVGTNAGVFQSAGPTFSTWQRLGTNLPTVPVFRLVYSGKDEMLLAGTLGRGSWTLSFKAVP